MLMDYKKIGDKKMNSKEDLSKKNIYDLKNLLFYSVITHDKILEKNVKKHIEIFLKK